MTDFDIKNLSLHYQSLPATERMIQFFKDFGRRRIILTSSFGTNSAMLLHLYAQARTDPIVHFIDTGFHFPETMNYKRMLVEHLGLRVVDVRPDPQQHAYTERDKTWRHDPDFCCAVNKVGPLTPILSQNEVWIAGVMSWQTPHRAHMSVFERDGALIKFSPLLDVSQEERDRYVVTHNLPAHPLLADGFASVGCTHCTKPGEGRLGRWPTRLKTECGLHR